MSRFDSVGLFWQEYKREKTRGPATSRERPLAPIPEPVWTPPTEFPRLEAASELIIDVETYDPNLRSKGPGDMRGDGHLIGIAVGTPEGDRWYFPMRHTLQPELNMDPDKVLAWARDELTRPGQLKIGANLLYDLFWLAAEGVHVPGPYLDVQWVEAVINENAASLSLDALGERYLGEGKETGELYEWCARSYGGNPDGSQRANLYRAPVTLVGPYAEGDVDVPARVWREQRPIVEQWGVQSLIDMEHRLIPMLVAMRRRGIRVDLEGAQQLHDELQAREHRAQNQLDAAAGQTVNVHAAQDIATAFDRQGIEYPHTATGRPSFTKEWLEANDHPLAQAVLDVRRYNKARGTFVDGYVQEGAVGDRVHPLLHPLRTDENGAISGRFASSQPNIQNIPSRDPELGPLIRGLFLPEEGEQWRSYDYSQIEFRKLVHFARGPGAGEVRQQFCDDPNTDFHSIAQQMIYEVTGRELGRKPTKNINFGLVFTMGKAKLIRSLGVSEDQGEALWAAYHEGLPFVQATSNLATRTAGNRGYVRTIAGRIARFDLWEPKDWELRRVVQPSVDRDWVLEQVQKYIEASRREGERPPKPGVVRAYTHKALNRILQGSAADVIKRAMVDIWESGVCDVVGAPLNQVHDELNFSDPRTPESEEAFGHVEHLMVNAWPSLRVPLAVDCSMGDTWGSAG